MWKSYRVNYVYLFEFDPRRIYELDELLIKSSRITILFFLNILLYFKISRGEIQPLSSDVSNYIPLVMLLTTVCLMLFPLWKTSTIYDSIRRVVFAPFYEVTFYTAFLGDVLTSLVKPIVDLCHAVCFYASGEWRKYFQKNTVPVLYSCEESALFTQSFIPLVISLPLFFRFIQSIRRYYDTSARHPNLTNALKYALAYCLVLLGAMHPSLSTSDASASSTSRYSHVYQGLWVVAFAGSTTYTYSWDVFVDWGLGDTRYHFLRKRRMFADSYLYYIAIALDFFLRFSWCLTLVPQLPQLLGLKTTRGAEIVTLVISYLELFRRTYWTMLRVEYEHLHNSQGYRRVDFIPLHFESRASKQKYQDQEAPRKEVLLELCSFVAIVVGISALTVMNPESQP